LEFQDTLLVAVDSQTAIAVVHLLLVAQVVAEVARLITA
jgi:hypothetical protein